MALGKPDFMGVWENGTSSVPFFMYISNRSSDAISGEIVDLEGTLGGAGFIGSMDESVVRFRKSYEGDENQGIDYYGLKKEGVFVGGWNIGRQTGTFILEPYKQSKTLDIIAENARVSKLIG